jgi:transposase InsO family protein
MINRRHDGRASCLARRSLKQLLLMKPRIYAPATWKGGHESEPIAGAGRLSDNGSPNTARETRALTREIGLVPLTTPIESSQSNGMAEVFVKTLKRDYARVSRCPNAATVLHQPEGWFEQYNTVHPQALDYRSPREFRKHFVERRPTTRSALGVDRMAEQCRRMKNQILSYSAAATRSITWPMSGGYRSML